MAILGILLLAVYFAPLFISLKYRKDLNQIKKELEFLKGKLETASAQEGPVSADSDSDKTEKEQPGEANQPVEEKPFAESITPGAESSHAIRKKDRKSSARAGKGLDKKLEKSFLDKGTGIFGAAIVVLGAGFLSIYAAVRLSEFYRFILLLGLSAVPAVFSFLLRGKKKWEKQSAWMLSISGAVFLFACLGSGGVPGLQWIRNPFASLALLAAGILVNLGLGVLGRKQYFASFHTLLSLLALFIIPPASTTLFIAAVICLFAVIQTYNGRWDLHLILTISGFFAYHLFWIYTLQAEGFHEILRIQGVLVASVIFAVAALVHYRKSYGSERFELFPFLVHLANWFYFTFAMILYVGEYQWRTVPLILAALAAYLLSEKARDREIIWLRMTDIMICQILTVTALLTLLGWEMRPVMIGGLIFAETVLFSRIMVRQKILSLFRIGINLNYAATLALVVLSLANPGYAAAVITGGACFLALYMHHTLYAREDSLWIEGDRLFFIKKRGRNFPLTGLAAGLFALTVQIISTSMIEIPLTGGYPLAALFGIILLYVQSRETSRSMTAGALLFLALFGLTGWDKLLQATIYWRLDTADQLITGGSLLATGGAAYGLLKSYSGQKRMVMPGIVFLCLTAVTLSYALLTPFSDYITGFLWLLVVFLSSLYKPFHDRIKEGGLIFLGAFLILFFTRYGIWEQSRDLLKYRYLMEILAVPAILSRFVLRKKALRRKKMILHALFLEVAILFVLTVLYLEIPLIWLPTALGALAVVLALPFFVSEDSRRILLYSLLIEWAALISLILISAKSGMAGGIYVSGTITIALSTGYIIYLIRSGKRREEIITPLSLRYAKISTLAREKLNAVLLYPLAVATALFIYITFDARILTLLWALECFLVFSASIFLREEHFRFVSQAGLLLCVARLLLVDMTGSSLLIRGIVFLGVGTLMLSVNLLYNRYKERFNS